MKIIKKGLVPPKHLVHTEEFHGEIECYHCNSVLEITQKDAFHASFPQSLYVICPVCGWRAYFYTHQLKPVTKQHVTQTLVSYLNEIQQELIQQLPGLTAKSAKRRWIHKHLDTIEFVLTFLNK